ncbi:2-oxoglutarate dehydrogenase E1 component, partial [Aureobasidium melanogenum]
MLRASFSQCGKRLATAGSRTSFSSLARSTRPVVALTQTRRDLAVSQFRSYAVAAEDTNKGVDPNDSFLQGNTANYIDEMYMEWKRDPKSVHVSWQVYFRNMEKGDMPISQAFQPPPTIVPAPEGGAPGFSPTAAAGVGDSDLTNHLKVQLLVRAYQARGHHKAKIDPLGIRNEASQFGYSNPRELNLEHYNFTEADMEQEFSLGPG